MTGKTNIEELLAAGKVDSTVVGNAQVDNAHEQAGGFFAAINETPGNPEGDAQFRKYLENRNRSSGERKI